MDSYHRDFMPLMMEDELPDPLPHWSCMKPIPTSQPRKWHAKVGLNERKQCIRLIATMLNGDLEDPNVLDDHERIHKQISIARKEERDLFEMATSTSEYFRLWRERTTEVSYMKDELLDQEDDVTIDQQVQTMLEENAIDQRRGFRPRPIDFPRPNIPCDANDPCKLRLMNLKHRRNAKMARKETKNVANVTVTEDQGYNIEDVLQNLEISEASSKKSKRKKKKKKKSDPKINDQQDKEQTDAQDQQDPNPDPADEYEEPILNKNGLELSSGPECSTCFEPRIRSFLLWPCGHATFCEKCATYFCDSEDKRCPTCRATITGKVRVFS